VYIIWIAAKSMRVSLVKIAPIKADESLVRAELLGPFVGGDESLVICNVFLFSAAASYHTKSLHKLQTLARHDHLYLRR